jgi:hypothetical protein
MAGEGVVVPPVDRLAADADRAADVMLVEGLGLRASELGL